MSPLGMMVFRLYRPTGFTLLMAVIAWGYTATIPTTGTLAAIYGWLQWLPLALLLVATLQGLHASYRLWRWDSRGVDMCECGGLLGRERVGRWGPYRPCLMCLRNISK